MSEIKNLLGDRELVMVSNRLPVDHFMADDGSETWLKAPGGLVTAVEPIVQELGCHWIGWAGSADIAPAPFSIDSMSLVSVTLDQHDLENYYEGFSNGTIWPLYHDVITPPKFHREWWESYQSVNLKFAKQVAETASDKAVVWIHDYHLQLVPAMLRELRPDLTIAFFLHIPFPARAIFAQLPWRKQIVEGLLGADVIGFQRVQDANSFRAVAERYASAPANGNIILVNDPKSGETRSVLAQEFPISIDFAAFSRMAAMPEVQRRASEIRAELGNPMKVVLGVDRLDYTKGIHHRLKAYAELLAEAETGSTVLVQVASPSREQVEAYKVLRDEIEVTVGRINGEYGSIGYTPVVYLHQGFSREEMAALYLAADVMLVTALRDGMNLVAKEYVASRGDDTGVLILSEFTGSADELRQALLVNPHNIEGLKTAILRAVHMPNNEQSRRMTALRRVVKENDVNNWAQNFLRAVQAAGRRADTLESGVSNGESPYSSPLFIPKSIEEKLRRLATTELIIIALDFDGTLSPIVEHPANARILPRAQQALDILQRSPGVQIALLSGRSLVSIKETGINTDGWIVSGSHGAELDEASLNFFKKSEFADKSEIVNPLTSEEVEKVGRLVKRVSRVFGGEKGVYLESKPFGIAVHTRQVSDSENAEEILEAVALLGQTAGLEVRAGKQVREISIRRSDKGQVLQRIRARVPYAPVLFIGDDVTDEDGFAVLRHADLGIKVGLGESIASERVSTPEDVAAILAMLAEYRTGFTVGSSARE